MTTNQEKIAYVDLTLANIKEATNIFLLRTVVTGNFNIHGTKYF